MNRLNRLIGNQKYVQACKMLGNHDTDIHNEHRVGYTQYFYRACMKGYLKTAQWLWENLISTNYNITDLGHICQTALYNTMVKGHLKVLQWLWTVYETHTSVDIQLLKSALPNVRYCHECIKKSHYKPNMGYYSPELHMDHYVVCKNPLCAEKRQKYAKWLHTLT